MEKKYLEILEKLKNIENIDKQKADELLKIIEKDTKDLVTKNNNSLIKFSERIPKWIEKVNEIDNEKKGVICWISEVIRFLTDFYLEK